MNRQKRIIRNVIIIVIFYLFVTRFFGLFLNPISAFEYAERDNHYGPSKIVHTENYGKAKYILGKYDKWISYSKVSRFLFYWTSFNPIMIEIQKDKAISYYWVGSDRFYEVFGIVNDKRITKVEITLADGNTLVQNEFYDGDLFLFLFDPKNEKFKEYLYIRGYDSESKILFEVKF
jgi:hypothetical protein